MESLATSSLVHMDNGAALTWLVHFQAFLSYSGNARRRVPRLVMLTVTSGDEGNKYHPEGYTIPQVGPERMSGKGEVFLKEAVEGMRRTRTGGCIFAT